MQPPVAIVKASAGSGKTYRLTQDYLGLLLEGDPLRYKHILAVTFTNKATEEMKSRVIKALHQLSRSNDPQAPQAADALRRMLHDYGCFSVSTIDKFFQTVMRAFAREIGQYASYRVELDDDAVLTQVVDRMLEAIAEPGGELLLRWLKEYSFDLVEQGKSWNMAAPLKEMAEHFLDESFLLKMRNISHILTDKERIGAFRKKLDAIINGFEQEARRIAGETLALMGRHGRAPEDFKGKSRSPMRVFRKWADGTFEAPKAEALRESFDAFPDREALSDLVEAAIAHYEQQHILWNSARIIRNNLHLLGIYADVHRHLQAYLQENNVVLLKQSTDLLSRIIADDDTPFVYEKIGNRYDHLLLDEAQDTSVLQWNNFRPLFANSVAQGNRNLVVGDIKQSIYRWRGSDWRLMSEYLYRDLGRTAIHDETLVENWRSGAAVVGFNNTFFAGIGPALETEVPPIGEEISRIYADCRQRIPAAHANDPEGFVRLTFLPSDGGDSEEDAPWKETALHRMIEDIAALRAEGYAYKDITVLVRKNTQGAEVAAHLMGQGINVLTEDSLHIDASPCIGRLMTLLSCQVDPDDPVNRLMAEQIGVEVSAAESGSLYETCERLLEDPALSPTEADLPFVHAFLDAVLVWQEKYGSSLRGFVKWWDDAGHKTAICAPDGQDAVRVMTIHKAKGLSLDTVIIPFVDETFIPATRLLPTLWCETSGPFAELGLIPLKAVNGLAETCFAADLMQERIYEYVDVVNNWYVAFTRACSRLLLYAPQPKKPHDYKLGGIAEALYSIFADKLDGKLCYETGSRDRFVREETSSTLVDDPQPAFTRVAMTSDRLKLSLHGEDYFAAEASARQQGIKQHFALSGVTVDPELERRSGGRHWFDGSYRVMNEASIVTEQGEIYRPDRVLIAPDGSRVIVIDYKFGHVRTAHKSQVRHYVDLMRQMGYPSVEGWLWYVSAGEVVRV